MARMRWGNFGDCAKCGDKATRWFKETRFMNSLELELCKDCLQEVLEEKGVFN